MKKAIFVSFILCTALSVFTTNAATDPTAKDTTSNVTSYSNQGQLFLKLNDAIYKRLLNLYNKHVVRNNDWQNLYNRENRLVEKQKNANVDSGTAKLSRDGELNPVDYSGSYNNPDYTGVNFIQNWRRCAVNYYVEGGKCTAEEMKQDLIYASTHKVETMPDTFWKQDVAVINDIRDVQRLMESSPQIGAGQQVERNDSKISPYRDVLGSPYQKMPDVTPQQ